ncbi:MAG: hypothetical protein ACYTBS_09370 [Planctomycetota bacterium]|jgi:serine/threonine-protein kinase
MSESEERNDERPEGNGAGPIGPSDDSEVVPSGQIGPFRIERELGRGAVGVVYLAHDTKLGRSVAIKSLPAEVMEKPDRHYLRRIRRGRGCLLSDPGIRARSDACRADRRDEAQAG